MQPVAESITGSSGTAGGGKAPCRHAAPPAGAASATHGFVEDHRYVACALRAMSPSGPPSPWLPASTLKPEPGSAVLQLASRMVTRGDGVDQR